MFRRVLVRSNARSHEIPWADPDAGPSWWHRHRAGVGTVARPLGFHFRFGHGGCRRGFSARLLVLPGAACPTTPGPSPTFLASRTDRCLRSRPTRTGGPRTVARGGSHHPDSAGDLRFDRIAAHTRGAGRLPRGYRPRRLFPARRPAPGLTTIRRAHGQSVAAARAIRGGSGSSGRRRHHDGVSQCPLVSRVGHRRLQSGSSVRSISPLPTSRRQN